MCVCMPSIMPSDLSIGRLIWAVGVSEGVIQLTDGWLWAKVTDGGAGIEWLSETGSCVEWKLIVWTLLSIRLEGGLHSGGGDDSHSGRRTDNGDLKLSSKPAAVHLRKCKKIHSKSINDYFMGKIFNYFIELFEYWITNKINSINTEIKIANKIMDPKIDQNMMRKSS